MNRAQEYGMTIQEYLTHVKTDIVFPIDYGKWIKFSDSFPPLKEGKYSGTDFEILYEGNPYFHTVFHNGEYVCFRDYDMTTDLLEMQLPEYMECYWRYIPNPPGNEGYDCG